MNTLLFLLVYQIVVSNRTQGALESTRLMSNDNSAMAFRSAKHKSFVQAVQYVNDRKMMQIKIPRTCEVSASPFQPDSALSEAVAESSQGTLYELSHDPEETLYWISGWKQVKHPLICDSHPVVHPFCAVRILFSAFVYLRDVCNKKNCFK